MKLDDGTPDPSIVEINADKDVSTTLVLDSDHEEEALDTVNPFDPMASDGDTAISCKECGKLCMGPNKVFALMQHLIPMQQRARK